MADANDNRLETPRQREKRLGVRAGMRTGQSKAYEQGRVREAKRTLKNRITPDAIWASKGLYSNEAFAPDYLPITDTHAGDPTEAPKPMPEAAKTVPRKLPAKDNFFKGKQSDRAKTLGVTKIVQYPREPVGQYDQDRGQTTQYDRYGGTEGVAQNGHYILFYINVNERSKMSGDAQVDAAGKAAVDKMVKGQSALGDKFSETKEAFQARKEKTAKLARRRARFASGPASTRGEDGLFNNTDIGTTISRNLNMGLAGARSANATKGGDESLYAKKINTSQRLTTAVALYMPAQVQTSYQLQYSDVEYGFKAQGFAQLFDILGNEAGDIKGQQVTAFGRKVAQGVLNTIAPGATAAINIKQGVVVSNRMELSFQSVGRREFQFTFNFLPKSEQEAKEVEDIISIFKFYSHPDFIIGSAGNMMTIPDTFDISYMYQGAENSFLNKISTCFCTNIQVTYGGDRYSTHTPTESRHGKGALSPPPVRSSLTMTFKELEILTKPRIDQGY